MNAEKLQLTLGPTEDYEHYILENSTVVSSTDFPSIGALSRPKWPSAFALLTAAVDIEGTIFAYTEPTWQWMAVYPSPEPSLDILEDLDIPLKPKKTRRAKGIVVRRRKAGFTTAFSHDLFDDVNSD